MKNRYCSRCNKILLHSNKIVTPSNEFLSLTLHGIEYNWCNDYCYERWRDDNLDSNVVYVDRPEIYFKE